MVFYFLKKIGSTHHFRNGISLIQIRLLPTYILTKRDFPKISPPHQQKSE